MAYSKNTWQDGVTPLDASHFNHIEDGIANAHNDIATLDQEKASASHNHNTVYLGINAKASDSDKLDGQDSSYFSTASHNHNATYLGITAKASDSNKLDGLDSTYFCKKGTTVTKTSNYTLQAGDAENVFLCNSSSSITITLPANATISIPLHCDIVLIQKGAGKIILNPASGVSLTSKGTETTDPCDLITLRKVGTNEWYAFGDFA